jgi:hypothetical protein
MMSKLNAARISRLELDAVSSTLVICMTGGYGATRRGLGCRSLQIVHFDIGFAHLLEVPLRGKRFKRFSVVCVLSANAESHRVVKILSEQR